MRRWGSASPSTLPLAHQIDTMRRTRFVPRPWCRWMNMRRPQRASGGARPWQLPLPASPAAAAAASCTGGRGRGRGQGQGRSRGQACWQHLVAGAEKVCTCGRACPSECPSFSLLCYMHDPLLPTHPPPYRTPFCPTPRPLNRSCHTPPVGCRWMRQPWRRNWGRPWGRCMRRRRCTPSGTCCPTARV